jgi:hypothetical protein
MVVGQLGGVGGLEDLQAGDALADELGHRVCGRSLASTDRP